MSRFIGNLCLLTFASVTFYFVWNIYFCWCSWTQRRHCCMNSDEDGDNTWIKEDNQLYVKYDDYNDDYDDDILWWW